MKWGENQFNNVLNLGLIPQKLMAFGDNKLTTQLVTSKMMPTTWDKRMRQTYFLESKMYFREKLSAANYSMILLGNVNLE